MAPTVRIAGRIRPGMQSQESPDVNISTRGPCWSKRYQRVFDSQTHLRRNRSWRMFWGSFSSSSVQNCTARRKAVSWESCFTVVLWRLDRQHVLERSGYIYNAFRYLVVKKPAKIQSVLNCKLQVLLNPSCKMLAGLLRKSAFDSAGEVTSNCRISDECIC